MPDAIVAIPVTPESEKDDADVEEAATDRRLKKHRLLKGWRMPDAPTLQDRAVQDPATWGSRRTLPLAAPKAQARFPTA